MEGRSLHVILTSNACCDSQPWEEAPGSRFSPTGPKTTQISGRRMVVD